MGAHDKDPAASAAPSLPASQNTAAQNSAPATSSTSAGSTTSGAVGAVNPNGAATSAGAGAAAQAYGAVAGYGGAQGYGPQGQQGAQGPQGPQGNGGYGSQGMQWQGSGAGTRLASQAMGVGASAAGAAGAAVAADDDAARKSMKFHESLGFHILMVALISLLLLIPTMFFSFVLDDRQSNEATAIRSMVGAWGGEQELNDIELYVNTEVFQGYDRNDEDEVIKAKYELQRMRITPNHARNLIEVDTQKRYRGNYEASLYSLEVTQEARFNLRDSFDELANLTDVHGVFSDSVTLLFSISDTKGIDEIKSVRVNNKLYTPEPADRYNGFIIKLSPLDVQSILAGRPLPEDEDETEVDPLVLEKVPALENSFDAEHVKESQDESTVAVAGRNQLAATKGEDLVSPTGFGAKQGLGLGLYGEKAPAGVIVVEATYLVRGSQNLSFAPVARVSELEIRGKGVVPSFAGDFLPRDRQVNATDLTFSASYYQNNLSTGHAAILQDSSATYSNKSYIIGLSDSSESYVLIERLTKYVLLVITMTYVAVMAFEVLSRRSVSLVQYVVVGAALILFYLVLLALSEHTSFTISYVTAALLLSAMVALYLKAVLSSKRDASCVFVLLLAMYAVLFAIVHIEAYALLVGTALLVVMLGIVMFITRRINVSNFRL